MPRLTYISTYIQISEFFQNSGIFARKFGKFQHFLKYRRNSDKISSKSEQKSMKRIPHSLDLPRNFSKFLFKLSPTRVNFCAASSNTFPGHEEGAAKHLRRLPPLLSFFQCFLFDRATSVFSERFFNRLRPKKKIRK